jgi:hypothetical protein
MGKLRTKEMKLYRDLHDLVPQLTDQGLAIMSGHITREMNRREEKKPKIRNPACEVEPEPKNLGLWGKFKKLFGL